eukprot:235373_1
MSSKLLHYISKRFNAATLKGKQTISLQQHADWTKNGFIIVRALFDKDEMSILRESIETDTLLQNNTFSVNDGPPDAVSMAIWKYLSNDSYATFMASNRMYRIMSGLSNHATMQHFQTKLMSKHAQTDAGLWCQDYGEWYDHGLLFPDLITGYVAVDDCKQSKGCLEIVAGSHLMGHIEHIMVDGHLCVDRERMKWIHSVCDKQLIEMKSGDTVFFHCNILHRLGTNDSNQSQRALSTVYNKKTNTCFKDPHACVDVEIREDSDIKKIGVVPTVDASVFMNKQ